MENCHSRNNLQLDCHSLHEQLDVPIKFYHCKLSHVENAALESQLSQLRDLYSSC